jgi:hypothetical protein
MVKHILHIAVFSLVITCFDGQTQQENPSKAADETPPIIIASQPDSPLVITTSVRWAIPSREILDLYVTVTNQDVRSVRSYTTRIDLGTQNGQTKQCPIMNVYFPGKVIKQEEKDGKSRFIAPDKNMPLSPIKVSVDYVEFTDDSTWGQDTCQTVEYLAGERAGGEAAIKWFQNFIREKGMKAALDVIRNRDANIEKPDNPSARWNEAFRQGVEIVGHRIMTAYQTEGEAEVAVVLSKPYDASGVRPQ